MNRRTFYFAGFSPVSVENTVKTVEYFPAKLPAVFWNIIFYSEEILQNVYLQSGFTDGFW